MGISLFDVGITFFQSSFQSGLLQGVASVAGPWVFLGIVPVLALAGLIVGLIADRSIGEERHHGVAGIMASTAMTGGRLPYCLMPIKALLGAFKYVLEDYFVYAVYGHKCEYSTQIPERTIINNTNRESKRMQPVTAKTVSEQGTPNGFWVLLATILASSMAFIDGTALNVALDALQKDLQATGADLLWVVNAYLLSVASLILLGGSLGDRFGRKRIFRLGILIFTISSMVCGLSPNIQILILARAVQGIGGALMVPGSLAIISATFAKDRVGQAIGTWSSFSTITTIGGPILGGILASHGLWRVVFFINVPLAVVALYSLTKVPETRDASAPARLDYLGTVLVALGLAALTYGAIDLGRNNGIAESPVPLLFLAGGLIAVVAFVIVEARSPNPMVKLSLFGSRTFSGTNLMTLFLYGGLLGATVFLPLNLIQVQGYEAQVAGFTFLPFTLLLAIMSPFMGRVVDRIGPRIPLIVGPAIVGIGFIILSLPGVTAGPNAFWTTYLPGIIGLGIGMGITVAPLTTAVMGAVSSNQAGIASGINNAMARSAQVLAVALLGAVALSTFSTALAARTSTFALPEAAQQALNLEASKLGNAHVPDTLDADTQVNIKQAIQLAFVDTFRRICYIAAVLAWISALISAVLIEKGRLSSTETSATAAP